MFNMRGMMPLIQFKQAHKIQEYNITDTPRPSIHWLGDEGDR